MPQDASQNVAMQTCIDDCQECWTLCTETVQHCLRQGGRHAESDHIRLLLDCADSCDQLAEDSTMMDCAEVCRRCVDSCHQVSGARV